MAKKTYAMVLMGTIAINIFSSSNTVHYANAFATLSRTTRSHATIPALRRHNPLPPLRQSSASSTDPQTEREELIENAVEMIKNDPITQEIRSFQSLDANTIINTSLIVIIALAVLSKLTLVDYGIMRGWTASEMAVRVPVDNWLGYSEILDKAPVYTKAVTSATVYTIGDFIAQRTEGASMGQLDRMRLLRSMLVGLIGHGPMSHVWYEFSEGIFTDVLHWTEWWSFFPKVMADQLTWGPFWNNSYILLIGLLKGDALTQIWADVKRTTIPLIVSGLKLWPLAHCVTYGLIPVENRLLWVDMVEILWVTILATTAAGGGQAQDEASVEAAQETEVAEAK